MDSDQSKKRKLIDTAGSCSYSTSFKRKSIQRSTRVFDLDADDLDLPSDLPVPRKLERSQTESSISSLKAECSQHSLRVLDPTESELSDNGSYKATSGSSTSTCAEPEIPNLNIMLKGPEMVLKSRLQKCSHDLVLYEKEGCYFLQTKRMKLMYEKYPELIYVNTSLLQLKNCDLAVCLLLCQNSCALGHLVAICLLPKETNDVVLKSLQLFHINNPDQFERVRMIVLDRDDYDIANIVSEIGSARVQIVYCFLHVMKVFSEQLGKEIELTPGDRQKILELLHAMCFSAVENEFVSFIDEMRSIPACKGFYDYFCTNWENRRHLWTSHSCAGYYTFGYQTNYCLENLTNKIQATLDDLSLQPRLDVAILCKKLLNFGANFFDTDLDVLLFKEERIKQMLQQCNSLFVKIAVDKLTEYAARLVHQQVLLTRSLAFTVEQDEEMTYTVSCHNQRYRVTNDFNRCSCLFYDTFLLPCCHMILILQLEGKMYSDSHLPERWLKIESRQTVSNLVVSSRHLIQVMRSASTAAATELTRRSSSGSSRQNKFNRIIRLMTELANLASNQENSDFDHIYNVIMQLYKIFNRAPTTRCVIKEEIRK